MRRAALASAVTIAAAAVAWAASRPPGSPPGPTGSSVLAPGPTTPAPVSLDASPTWVRLKLLLRETRASLHTYLLLQSFVEDLLRCNPGYEQEVHPAIVDGRVVGLRLPPIGLRDLTPVRRLGDLRRLDCGADDPGRPGDLADLGPLAGTTVRSLSVRGNRVHDLSPLAGLPLEEFDCRDNPVADLAPLRAVPPLRRVTRLLGTR